MKSINFNDQELESMIEMYTTEMEESQKYVAQIQELLKKLGAKPTKVEPVEKEPKAAKKKGRKPAVKVVEKAEPKKRGRKPKVVVPTIQATIPTKPVKIEVKKKAEPKKTIEVKPKAGKKAIHKAPPLKVVSAPTAKSVPVAANKTNTKKIAAKSKVVVEKKPVVKPTPKKKAETKVAAKVESVVSSLLTKEPKKEVKKVVKTKSTEKKRIEEMATSAKLVKPKTKKASKVEPVVETAPVAPTVPPTE